MSAATSRRAARHDLPDGGYVALMTAILLPVLLGLAALAVNVSSWYLEVTKEQRVADAAALAGAVYLPGDQARAFAVAQSVAAKNGFVNGQGSTSVVVSRTSDPTQLQVTATRTVSNFFGRVPLLGTPLSRFGRTATAQYAGPLVLGSPCNVLGNDDMETSKVDSAACSGNTGYWLNMAGASTNKARGDSVGALWCDVPDDGVGIDGCSAPYAPYPGSVNTDTDPRGYLYAVQNGPSTSGSLTVQMYDAGYVYTGNDCSSTSVNNAAGVTNDYVTTKAESTARYSSTAANAYCSGDNSDGGQQDDGTPVTTTVTLWSPSPSSTDPLGGHKLCTTVIPGAKAASLKPILDRTSPTYDKTVAQYFHRWVTLCPSNPIVPAAGSTYVVQVQTSGPNGVVGGGGQNRYALRATTGSASADAGLTVSALQHMSLYFNKTQASTSNPCRTPSLPAAPATCFNVLRLPTGSGNHVLTLRLFDLGDGTGGDAVNIVPPDSSTLGTSAWDPAGACTLSNARDPVAAAALLGQTPHALTACSFHTTAGISGGRWIVITIPIPPDYRCTADSNATKCWVKVGITPGGAISDTTTWEATLDGDPVRLVY